MSAATKRRKHLVLFLTVLITFLLLASVFVIHCLKLAFSEDLFVKKGSLDYYLVIERIIRNFPTRDLIAEEWYYHTCGDGTKPPGNELRFLTRADRETVTRDIDTYLTRNGYERKNGPGPAEQIEYGKSGQTIRVRIGGAQGPPFEVVVWLYY
jgi:hypothetical protein